MLRADSLARAGDYVAAVKEADAAAATGADSNTLYSAGCIYALAAAAARDETALADAYAATAVKLLNRAATAGFADANHLRTDPDLSVLHGRGDFHALSERIGKPDKPN